MVTHSSLRLPVRSVELKSEFKQHETGFNSAGVTWSKLSVEPYMDRKDAQRRIPNPRLGSEPPRSVEQCFLDGARKRHGDPASAGRTLFRLPRPVIIVGRLRAAIVAPDCSRVPPKSHSRANASSTKTRKKTLSGCRSGTV